MKNIKVVCLVGLTAALASACTVSVPAPSVEVTPPQADVTIGVPTVGVPDSYVWDGNEYVGMVGGQYMYLGTGGVWLGLDPFRLDRFHGWERGHADWHRRAIRNEGHNARGRGPVRREEHHEERR